MNKRELLEKLVGVSDDTEILVRDETPAWVNMQSVVLPSVYSPEKAKLVDGLDCLDNPVKGFLIG